MTIEFFKTNTPIQNFVLVISVLTPLCFAYFYSLSILGDPRLEDNQITIFEFYWFEWILWLSAICFIFAVIFAWFDALSEARYSWFFAIWLFAIPALFYLYRIYKQDIGEDSSLYS